MFKFLCRLFIIIIIVLSSAIEHRVIMALYKYCILLLFLLFMNVC